MLSHRPVAALIGDSVTSGLENLWPLAHPFATEQPVSLATLARRLGPAGNALMDFERDAAAGVWKHLTRGDVGGSLRSRLRHPARMDQSNTGLCGPVSLLVELARRNPPEYVRAAGELFTTGSYSTLTGRKIVAEEELRETAMPDIAAAEWLLGASLRDDENVWEDVDPGSGPTESEWNGLETLTTPWEMAGWVRDVLDLEPEIEWCVWSDELDVLRDCEKAVTGGGVAFLCIDGALIKDGGDDDEEDVWFRRLPYKGPSAGVEGPPHHSRDDGYFPTHWVIHLGGMTLDEAADEITLPVWSWASVFTVFGSAQGVSEYLYCGVIGRA